MTREPVSWLLIEPGWRVETLDGADAGRVEEVTGDQNADIFDGLSVSTGAMARPRYVPSEQVATIREGVVRLKLDRGAFDRLGEYEEPPVEETIEPERASPLERVESYLVPPPERAERVGLLRRVLLWLGLVGRR